MNALGDWIEQSVQEKLVAAQDEITRLRVELEQATGERDAARVTFDWLDKGSKEKEAKLTEELNEARAGLVKVMTDNDAQMATVKTYYQRRTDNLVKAREARDKLLRSMWLYTDWKYVTTRFTTEEKELWADILDAGTVPGEEFIPVERWWRKDPVDEYGPVLRRCPNDDFPIRDEERGCPRCAGHG